MDTKLKGVGGVMAAIKARGDVGNAKKGVSLLGIVNKLTAKREAQTIKEGASESEPAKAEVSQ